MRFLLFLLCQTFLRLAFSVTFCERRNWRPFWYHTALSKWESPHFFARFKFRKLHANVIKSAAILPRNGQFVLTTSTNDKQSISRSQGDVITRPDQFQWRFLARLRSWVIGARTILFAIFPSIFEPALKIVLKVADEIQKNTTLKIALTYLKSRRCIALKKYRYKSSYVTCITFNYGRELGRGEKKRLAASGRNVWVHFWINSVWLVIFVYHIYSI